MPIHFECPCGKKLQVRDELAGKRIKCPTCGAASTAPGGKPQGQAKPPSPPTPQKPPTRKAAAPVKQPKPKTQPVERGPAFPSPRLRKFVLKFDIFAVLWVLAIVLYALWDIQGQVDNANRGRASYQGEARVPHEFQEFVITTVVWVVVCLWADRKLLSGSRFGFWLAWPGLLLTVIHEGIRVSFFYDLLRKRTQDSPWLSTLQVPLIACVLYVLAVLAYHYVYVRVMLAVRRDGPVDEDD